MDRLAIALLRFELHAAALVCTALLGCSDAGHTADGGTGSVDAALVDAAAGVRFGIALSTSACKDECPIYDLQLDQTGSVMFNGRGHTRQQGWGGSTVSQETAAELLALIVAADYWSLQDIYRETSDGCDEVEPDHATYTWNVTMNGPAKIVIDYQGCRGVPELEELRKIPALLIEKLGLTIYLGK